MMPWGAPSPALLLGFAGVGYLLGAPNAAHYLVRRNRNLDIRDFGSGNAGATNAGRLLGRQGFLVVLMLDAAKGAAAAGLARWLSGDPWTATAALAGAVLGHIWPVHLGFRGGKGVATFLGGWLVIDAGAVLVLAAAVLALLAVIRRFLPSGLLGLAAFPLILYARHASLPQAIAAMALVGIVWFAHRHQLDASAWRPRRTARTSLDRPRPVP